mgnify:CR=1 FL=1|nr:hypothetical protein [Allomuricauda sp.]
MCFPFWWRKKEIENKPIIELEPFDEEPEYEEDEVQRKFITTFND